MNPIQELLDKLDAQWLNPFTTRTTASDPTGGTVTGFLSKMLGMGQPSEVYGPQLPSTPQGPSQAEQGSLTSLIQRISTDPSIVPSAMSGSKALAAGSPANVRPSSGIGDPVASNVPPEARGFLNAVSGPEAGGKYDVRYTPKGGTKFTGTQHPNILEPGPDGPSSAAGRYQITGSTWRNMKGGEFTPEAQDNTAWNLAQADYKRRTGKDLLPELQQNGLTDQTLRILGPTWQAFTKQGGRDQALGIYQESVGRYKGTPSAVQKMSDTPADEVGEIPRLSQDKLMDKILSTMPENEVRKFGLEKLKRQILESQGRDYVSPNEAFDDMPTDQQMYRDQRNPEKATRQGLENRGLEMERQQPLYDRAYPQEDGNDRPLDQKLNVNDPVASQDYLFEEAAKPGETPAKFEEKLEMAKNLGLVDDTLAKIILASNVTPLPINPSANAGKSDTRQGTEQALDQINSGKGSNIKLIPIQQWQSYVNRRGSA